MPAAPCGAGNRPRTGRPGTAGPETHRSRGRGTDRQIEKMDRISNSSAVLEEQKNKRYDRQIRIWGKDGQRRLETAKVCLLGAGPT